MKNTIGRYEITVAAVIISVFLKYIWKIHFAVCVADMKNTIEANDARHSARSGLFVINPFSVLR